MAGGLTGGVDRLRGTSADRRLQVYGGTDHIGAGRDLVLGGGGRGNLFGDAGNGTAAGGSGTDALAVENTSRSRGQLLEAIDAQSGTPRIVGNAIDVTGISGLITIGEERISFRELERIRIGSLQAPEGR